MRGQAHLSGRCEQGVPTGRGRRRGAVQRLSGKPETWVLTLCGCPHSDTLDTGAGCHRLACLTLKVQFPVRGDHLPGTLPSVRIRCSGSSRAYRRLEVTGLNSATVGYKLVFLLKEINMFFRNQTRFSGRCWQLTYFLPTALIISCVFSTSVIAKTWAR